MKVTKKVLSPPVAERIVETLSRDTGSGYYLNELARVLGVYPNAVMQAVKHLESSGRVSKNRIGNRTYYRLTENTGAPFSVDEDVRWVKLLNRRTAYDFNVSVGLANTLYLPKVYGVSVDTFWYNSLTYGVYYDKKELDALGLVIEKRIAHDPDFLHQDVSLCKKRCEELEKFSLELPRLAKKIKTQADLLRLLIHFREHYLNVMVFMLVPHTIERFFVGKIRDSVSNEEVLQTILEPVFVHDEMTESAFSIAGFVKRNGKSATYRKLLSEHTKKFAYIPMWSLKDSPYTQDQFESQIDDIVQNVAEPNISRLQSIKLQKKRKQELESVLSSVQADRILRDQVFLLQEYMQLRTTRRLALTKAHYNILPVLAQASRYLQLEGEDIYDLSLEEIVNGLNGEKSVGELKDLVHARRDGWGVLVLEGQIQQIDGARQVVETILTHQIIDTNITKTPMIVTGRTACGGRVVGVVRVVHDFKELGLVQAGDILVTKMTTPEFVPAMNRAAGVVTDEGGATCHAAIVSREFGLPCIVGTGNATVVLHDGDMVELDADKGVVRIQSKGMTRRKDKVTGKSGFNGQVTGKVTKLRDISDAERIESGDIIITSEVTPMYLSFLYKVGGMIVEEGSLTSHARLYANALKIPTLVGIEGALDTFEDGDEIVLDSEKGYAKRV